MAIWLIIYENGTARIAESDHNPSLLATTNAQIETCVAFNNWEDAQTAMDVIREYRVSAKLSMSNTDAVNEQLLADKQAEIEALERTIQMNRENWKAESERATNWMRLTQAHENVMRTVMNGLAVHTIVQKTHRERNLLAQNYVRQLNAALSTPYPLDTDDIPF